ncbi:hypothetical protein EGM70_17745 [Enterobacteriaceae bacterium 89]|nr:hypothetical protein [Enterobacteriaceae bacterium 89]
MNLFIILLITLAAKLAFSFVVYLKAKHIIAGMSLPKKSAVIGSGWLFSYGVFHLLEEFI